MSCKMCNGKRSIWKLLFGFLPWLVRCPSCSGRGWVAHSSPPQPAPPAPRSNWRAPSRGVRPYSTASPQAGPGLPLIVDPFAGDAPDGERPPDVPVVEELSVEPDSGDATEDVSADAADGDAADEDAADQGTAY